MYGKSAGSLYGDLTPKVGCTDRLAINYDPSATVPCTDCCTYERTTVVGCRDRYANNYNPLATSDCTDCCTYTRFNLPLWIEPGWSPWDNPIELEPYTPRTYPYDVNVNDSICIRDTAYEDTGWVVNGEYGRGYNIYLERLYDNNPSSTPNWDSSGSLTNIEAAFKTLLFNKPNSRVFINKTDLTPWIIPYYSRQNPLTQNPNVPRFTKDCESVGGTLYEFSKNVIPYVRDGASYFACLCEVTTTTETTTDLPASTSEDLCATKIINRTTTPITLDTVSSNLVIQKATCGGFNDYIKILENNTSLGWKGETTPFFNEFVLTSFGIPVDDAKFIIQNYNNTNFAIYPYGSTTTLTITGVKKSKELLKKAFDNGANFKMPYDDSSVTTQLITSKNCCDQVKGLYKETSHQEGGRTVSRGICLCEEIKQPCPTLSSGLPIQTIETKDGGSVTYVDVKEECCSNASLQSKLKGTWTWDGRRCVLDNTETSESCDTRSTIMTINENPINIKDIECVGDVLTVSAYIYFEQPDNRCTNGKINNRPKYELMDGWDGLVSFYETPPSTSQQLSRYAQLVDSSSYSTTGNLGTTTQSQNTKCCYDTSKPIEGLLIIQDSNNVKIDLPSITYVDTFSSSEAIISTSNNAGQGFNKWIKLTTTIDLTTFNNTDINIGVEFTKGLFGCCDYNIFFDDIEVGCLKTGVIIDYVTEPCVGFDLGHCVIDNKKSWVYNPGKPEMSDNIYDKIVRQNGTNGMNIEQTGIIQAGGHGSINRVFAPSVDAELDFRDTDYFNYDGVIEKHSKLVLNSKQLILQFNMCPDNDCVLGSYGYLIDDDGSYILDDDGGRIIVQDEQIQFPNLVDLEKFKKTFQGFWIQIMEQFIPATTIFVAGEKWCNNRICEQRVVGDYLLDATSDSGDLSPAPTVTAPSNQTPKKQPSVSQIRATTTQGSFGGTTTLGKKANTNQFFEPGPITVGNTRLYGLENLDPEFANRITYTNRTY